MIVLLLALSSVEGLAPQADAILEEVDGRLVFEVESAAPRGDWKLETSMAGFTGSGYLTWTGPDLFGAPGKDALAWTVHVGRPGRYRLSLRNRHDFADSTLQNDCFTKMDEGPWIKTFSSTRGEWTWATRHELEGDKPPAAYDLGPGLHTFRISGRSRGFSLDRVHLTLDGSEDAARPVSPTVLRAMAGPSPPADVARKLRNGKAGEALRGAPEEVRETLLAFLRRRAEGARELEAVDRVEALEKLADLFKGAPEGEALAKEVDSLRADPGVQAELKAGALWRRIAEAVERLRPHNGKSDPTSEGFRRLNGPAMASIAAACRRLADAHPDTKAGRRAAALLALYKP